MLCGSTATGVLNPGSEMLVWTGTKSPHQPGWSAPPVPPLVNWNAPPEPLTVVVNTAPVARETRSTCTPAGTGVTPPGCSTIPFSAYFGDEALATPTKAASVLARTTIARTHSAAWDQCRTTCFTTPLFLASSSEARRANLAPLHIACFSRGARPHPKSAGQR